MAVTLNPTGITYSDGTSTATNLLPSGTRLCFHQAAAPTGWTQDVSDAASDRMLRVNTTGGGGVAGSHSPTIMNVVPSHTHSFSTGTESADHSHYTSGGTSGAGGHNHSYVRPSSPSGSRGDIPANISDGWTGDSTSWGGDHSHSWGNWSGGRNTAHYHSGSTDNGSSQVNWSPRYTNIIICQKN